MTKQEVMAAFKEALHRAAIVPGEILADGQLHRCGTEGKPNGKDGAYVLHLDPPASGWWQNYRTGESDTWTIGEQSTMTAEQRQALNARMERDKAARKAEQDRRHAEARDKAVAILKGLPEVQGENLYLTAKGVKAVSRIHADGDTLVVPVLGADGQPQTLQYIHQDGTKRFLPGGRVTGGFFPIKGDDGALFVVEGVATGLSVHEATGGTVLCAFNAGNLLAVAELARKIYPGRELVIAGDNDQRTEGNPGKTKAQAAAQAVGGAWVVPLFEDRPDLTDFNDLHQLAGLDAVEAAVRERCEVTRKDSAPSKAGPVAVNISEFLSLTIPEREHLLSPVIPAQGLTMLYAPRGMGKTFASLSMAWSVACGGIALRWTAERPRRVLYVDGEMPARTMQERLSQIAVGFSSEPPSPDYFRLITPDLQPGTLLNLATPGGQAALDPLLRDVDLLVIDNLATLARHGRENESESWTPVQAWLLDLRRRGMSVLLVHHAGKGGNQRGTSAREDILDCVIALRKPSDYFPEQGARFEVHLEKARGITGDAAKPFEAALTQGERGALTWTVRDLQDAQADRVRALLKEGLTIREIAEELKISKSTVGRLKGKIERREL